MRGAPFYVLYNSKKRRTAVRLFTLCIAVVQFTGDGSEGTSVCSI